MSVAICLPAYKQLLERCLLYSFFPVKNLAQLPPPSSLLPPPLPRTCDLVPPVFSTTPSPLLSSVLIAEHLQLIPSAPLHIPLSLVIETLDGTPNSIRARCLAPGA